MSIKFLVAMVWGKRTREWIGSRIPNLERELRNLVQASLGIKKASCPFLRGNMTVPGKGKHKDTAPNISTQCHGANRSARLYYWLAEGRKESSEALGAH